MVSCRDITLLCRGIPLLQNVSVSIPPGEFVALIGPNGAGKSTLLKVLGGLLTPTTGSVHIDDLVVEEKTREEQARRRGVMSQRARLDFPFAVRDVVMLGYSPHVRKGGRKVNGPEIALAALDRVEAGAFADRIYPTLSGGEAQRVDLARALVQIRKSPDVPNRYLFLDEPTASLDPARERGILKIVRELADEGVGVLAVLHDLNIAAEFADRIVLMKKGSIAAQGDPHEVLTPDHIESVFDVPATVMPHPHHNGPLVLIGGVSEMVRRVNESEEERGMKHHLAFN